MLHVIRRLLLSPLRRMTSMHTQATVVSADASVSRRLRELASELDAGKYPDSCQIAAALQSLAQQLLSSQAPEPAAKQKPAATADVEQLERSFAAPAVEKQHQHQHEQQQHQPEQLDVQPASKRQKRAPKSFDFSRYSQRYVALHVMYVGWDYHGFARQADTDNTIEGKLFPALRKVKLIPEDVEISALDYSRCGRTDKGVSALGQVLALKLRSNAAAGEPLPSAAEELDYPSIVNRALPDNIRLLGWADVQSDFNARFSALDREYKYFIVQDGSLDLSAMREAAGYLVGDHDYRNFCKADVAQVRNFRRVVLSADTEPAGVSCAGMDVIALRIKGTAFLWHQVRCIAAVLLMVGRGQERPTIVQQLLDIRLFPCKPQYSMATEEPLLLFSCGFNGLQWHRSEGLVAKNLAVVESQLERHLVAAALTSSIFEQLQLQRQDQEQLQQAVGPEQQQQQQQSDVRQQDSSSMKQLPVSQQQQHHAEPPPALVAAATGNSSSSISSSRWLAPRPPHIPLHKRATEPSIEERFEKAGISLELLNQKGLAAVQDV